MTEPTPATSHRSFHEKLDLLKQRLLAMSQRAEELLALAVEAFIGRDDGKAVAVLAADPEIDALEVEIEGLAVALLALQQPMARDLRFIVSALKITSDLERVGDHAVNIAQAARRVTEGGGEFSAPAEIRDMAGRTREMLSDALNAVVRLDGALGREICRRDDAVDALHAAVFNLARTQMIASPAAVANGLELLLVSRNLERVADLATNIAEDAVYLAEGKTIKHHLEDHRTDPVPPQE